MDYNITIGEDTKEALVIVGLAKFPFSEDELRKAYREKCHIHHPDKGGVHNEFIKLKNAYKLLVNLATVENEVAEAKINQMKLAKAKASDPLAVWETCKECRGMGYTTVYRRYSIPCPKCNSVWGKRLHGRHCNACNGSGKFTQARSKKVVNCLKCNGTGIYQCTHCHENSGYLKELKYDIECDTCNGLGEVKLKLMNPVIRPGSILR